MTFERFRNPYIDVRVKLGTSFRDKPFELLSEVAYQSEYLDYTLLILEGYRTDFATIPRLFWRVLPPYGKYAGAAVVHDWIVDHRLTGHATAAKIFREAMIDLHVSAWKTAVMYRAVRWFGPRWKSSEESEKM